MQGVPLQMPNLVDWGIRLQLLTSSRGKRPYGSGQLQIIPLPWCSGCGQACASASLFFD